jgi:ankyrin repeat protein
MRGLPASLPHLALRMKPGPLEDKGGDISHPQKAVDKEPSAYLRSVLPHASGKKKKRSIFFQCMPSQEDMDNYDMEKVQAIRSNDISTLRALLKKGKSFDACNRNGETLLHLACRRANLETVDFLVHEAYVKVDVQDDMGRTVLHDICWRATLNTEMMESMIKVVSPQFLLVEDVRGHSCFDYCRKEDWGKWISFIRGCSDGIKRRALLTEEIDFALEE